MPISVFDFAADTFDDDESFKFEVGQPVKLVSTGEAGQVIKATACLYAEDEYLVRYIDRNGCLQEKTWGESALEYVGTIH